MVTVLGMSFSDKITALYIKQYQVVCSGIRATIINDIFRIQNLNIPALKDLDGIMVREILVNKTIDLHNKRIGTTKIEMNDVITHIQDTSGNDIPIGYTRESPVNVLFLHPIEN
jgi:hypothetical protein